MTHDEAVALLPSYALGALDEEVAALEAHLDACEWCPTILAALLETTAAMAEAVEQIPPPAALRENVLRGFSLQSEPVAEPVTIIRRAPSFWRRIPRLSPLRSLVAALIILVLGFGAGTAVQIERTRASQAELALDRQGLALLTSTETANERLAPIANPTSTAHGHWYHHAGEPTQVVVVEFLPQLTGGEAYYGWLGLADGTWQAVGAIPIDGTGYGRAIVLGSDGATVRSVVVTRQSGPTASPAGVVILRWPTP